MWIHERADWPTFTWEDSKLVTKLATVRYKQGILLGKMTSLGFDFQQSINLDTLTEDIIKSSAIEGERFNLEDVRSSVARRLGLEKGGLLPIKPKVEGMVDIMLDATSHPKAPLSKERLCRWHLTLFSQGTNPVHRITVGTWRDDALGPMQVVSGPMGHEKVHYEAPSAIKLEDAIDAFLAWFNAPQTIDPILKAGIAHFWFVTIHPFDDGNGRIARIIGDMALMHADGLSQRFYSLSSQIERERKHYYRTLERQQRGDLDITHWLSWFLDCLDRAIQNAETTVDQALFRSQFWTRINQHPLNDRQRKVLSRMLEGDFKGFMNTSRYAKMTKCSTDTAYRDILDLKTRSFLIQNPGAGRSTSYRLNDVGTL